jgi:hypothetical protein
LGKELGKDCFKKHRNTPKCLQMASGHCRWFLLLIQRDEKDFEEDKKYRLQFLSLLFWRSRKRHAAPIHGLDLPFDEGLDGGRSLAKSCGVSCGVTMPNHAQLCPTERHMIVLSY